MSKELEQRLSQEYLVIEVNDSSNHFNDFKDAKKEFEIQYIHKLLQRTKGNVTHASREAGITRFGLQKIIKRIGINPNHYRT
jgi:DNA-binding NtrC family response regulator